MTSQSPHQFSLKTACWVLFVAAFGWRLLSGPAHPAIAIPVASVQAALLVLIWRRPGARSIARRRVLWLGWAMLLPFVTFGCFLAALYLLSAIEPSGYFAPSQRMVIVLFPLGLLVVLTVAVAIFSFLAINFDLRDAFSQDPRYGVSFATSCWATMFVLIRFLLEISPK